MHPPSRGRRLLSRRGADQVRAGDENPERRARVVVGVAMAAIAYIPLLCTHPGMIGADTKASLTLSPGTLMSRAWSLWDPNEGMGTVTHQNIGYLLPMGPWYWSLHALGLPMWVVQRLWLGTLLFAAGLGVMFLLRVLGWTAWPSSISALLYMFSPYVLQYEARISAILMPWAALPWLIGITIRAVRRGGWRDPALFALVAMLVGGVNATSLILAGIGPVLWLPFAVWLGEARWRDVLAVAVRIGLLTVITALWWISGLWVEGAYGLDVLKYTETVPTVAGTSTAVEVLRGLGGWFFYGVDALGNWVQSAVDYTQWTWLLGVTLFLPLVSFVAAAVTRFREKLYFAVMLIVGVTLAVGAYPYSHPSPLGGVLKTFANSSTVGLALRNTGRAVPLVALATAVLSGSLIQAMWARRPPVAALLASGLAGLAVTGMTPLFIGQFVDNQLQRPSQIPAYWMAAIKYLNRSGNATRIWEEPGQDFLHYRWGATLDPITPALTNRPYVDRELVPTGGAGSYDLLRAIDERFQEGVLEPDSLAPLARRMGVGDLVLRSDLQWERYRTPRPVESWQLFNPAPAGLTQVASFGPKMGDTSVIPFEDEQALATPPTAPLPPAIAVFSVDNPLPIVRAEPATEPVILAGDGEGMVDASAAGLLGGDNPVLYAATLDTEPGGYQQALAAGADLVLTDTNRKDAQRYGSIRGTFGYTQTAGEEPLVPDPNDAPLPVFPGATDDSRTVAVESGHGVAVVRASASGSVVAYDPESRPDLAIDGDPATAWRVGAFGSAIGQYLRIDLSNPTTTGVINLQQPSTPGGRYITKVRLHFDRGPDVNVTLGRQSRLAGGQTIRFRARTFHFVQITITRTSKQANKSAPPNGVGFSEVRIGTPPRPTVDEVLRLPTDLLNAVGGSDLAHRLVILMTRDQTNPAEPFTGNPEPFLARTFTLPSSRTFAFGGVASISALAPDSVIDPLLGRSDPTLVTNSSSRLPGDLAASSSSALDNDPATFWQPARGPQVGNWISVDLPHPVSLASLDLQVVADGRHSVPTRLGVTVDGGPERILDLPAITDRSTPGAVVSVPLSLPGVTAKHRVVFTIEGVRRITTLDNLSNSQITLPVGIAELGLPGIREPAPAVRVPDTCRTDLLTMDGKPVGVRLIGTTAAATERQELTIQSCGPPLVLAAGPHTLRSAPGQRTGIDIDRIVLASAPGGGADPTLGTAPRAGTAPAVKVLGQGRTWEKVEVAPSAGGAEWLVLGQSLNRGWSARVEGGSSLGAPTLIDGYANGWLLRAPAGKSVIVDLSWTPQHTVDMALIASALGAILCLGIVALTGRRTVPIPANARRPVLVSPWAVERRLPVRTAVALVVGAGAAGCILVNPVVGAGVAAIAAVSCAWPRGHAIVAGAGVLGVATGATMEVAGQVLHKYPTILTWPQHFETASGLTWAGVILMVTSVAMEWARGYGQRAE
jgi:hypothetical protein